MSMRRFTRLTNAFSKKVENHEAAIALHYMHYNFARIHQTLRVTPAMEASVADHVWSLEEIVNLIQLKAMQEPKGTPVTQEFILRLIGLFILIAAIGAVIYFAVRAVQNWNDDLNSQAQRNVQPISR